MIFRDLIVFYWRLPSPLLLLFHLNCLKEVLLRHHSSLYWTSVRSRIITLVRKVLVVALDSISTCCIPSCRLLLCCPHKTMSIKPRIVTKTKRVMRLLGITNGNLAPAKATADASGLEHIIVVIAVKFVI